MSTRHTAEGSRLRPFGEPWAPSLSRDGSRLAFVAPVGGRPGILVHEDGRTTSVPLPRGVEPTGVGWSPDGAWLAFAAAPTATRGSAVMVVRPDGSDLGRVSGEETGQHMLGPWLPDGESLCYSSTSVRPDRMTPILANIRSGSRRVLGELPGVGIVADLCASPRMALVLWIAERGHRNLLLVNLDTNSHRSLIGGGVVGECGRSSRIVEGGMAVIAPSNAGREFVGLVRVPTRPRGRPTELASFPAADLELLAVSRDGSRLALVWNVGGRSQVEIRDRNSSVQLGSEIPVEVIDDLAISADGSTLVVRGSGPRVPPGLWMLVLAPDGSVSRSEQVWGRAAPRRLVGGLARPRSVQVLAKDGLQLSAWLYQPRVTVGHPGRWVISLHGGPAAQERPSFNQLYLGLLQRGIGILAPNVRGSSGFGRSFTELDDGPRRGEAIADVETCRQYLVACGFADHRTIGIMGESYGGYAAIAAAADAAGEAGGSAYAAAVAVAAIVNFETFFASTSPWMASISKREFGDPEKDRPMMRHLSPIHRLHRGMPPTLVIHGAMDANVPVSEAHQLVSELRRVGVEVDYVEFAGEGHGITDPSNHAREVERIISWLDRHLSLEGERGAEGGTDGDR